MIGMENIKHYISIQGSIGAGKSTFLQSVREHIEENRLDATVPSHIDEDNLQKDYYLLVDEPIDEWVNEKYVVGSDQENISMLDAFYRDMKGMSFPFQIYTFTTRMRRLRDTLNKIVPTDFPRRIHIISERSMRADRLFFLNLCETNHGMGLLQAIYEEFFSLICDEVLKREDAMIYLPVSSSVCHTRIERRNRLQEVENTISEAYLSQLDDKHKEMIRDFRDSGRHVFELDEFGNELTKEEIHNAAHNMMSKIESYVKIL